jgi:hypothetical protein
MNTSAKVLIALATSIALIVGILGTTLIGTYNSFVTQENGLVAQYKYSNYFNKLKEAAQVPSMQVDGLKKLYDGVMAGRYGKDGSKAVFQMLKEQNPQLDGTLYVQIQRIVESGRNSFQADQQTLLDKKRVYENSTQRFPGNLLAGFLRFPSVKVKDIDIVTNIETEDAFKTKKAAPINLNN